MSHRAPALLAATICLTLLCAATATAGVDRWGSYAGAFAQPTPIAMANLENVVAIDAGNRSSYALKNDGTLWAFGENGRGQLGDGLEEDAITRAVEVSFPVGVTIVAIGEAEDVGFAIDSTGQGWTWGDTMCVGKAVEDTTKPQKVPGMTEAVAVQGGGHHVLWLLRNKTVEACGKNENGQLGVGQGITYSALPKAIPGLSNVVEVSAGEKSSCARTATGAVYDWGADYNGQVGNGVEQPSVYEPFKVPLPGVASEVSCGGDLPPNGHTLALVEGAVYGWGADGGGQLGDEKTQNKLTPARGGAVSSLGLTHVVASGACSLGLSADGDVYAWGSNADKALGAGKGKASLTPLLVDSGALEISGTAYNSLDRTP
jgi:alpha-tubulin suppressor-like RCC1 family protein